MRKIHIYLIASLLVLVMSWEYQRNVAASILSQPATEASLNVAIPEEAIRLRILAQSDSPRDQWLKREVRDEVVAHITDWVQQLESMEEARLLVEQSLPRIEQLVQEVIKERGFTYTSTVEYGQISFPAKLYGNQFYPAGEYEGLLITIGAGQGDNWWCVLFPPLCFVDYGTGTAVETKEESKDQESAQEIETAQAKSSEDKKETVEVRFFFAELFGKIKNLFV